MESNVETIPTLPPLVELTPNPSAFSVFAGVRQSVLERQLQENARTYLASLKSSLSEPESDEEESANSTFQLPKVSKSVFNRVIPVYLCRIFA